MQHPKSSHINQGPLRAHLMSIDDFMKEQEQFDAVGSADLKARAKAALANSNIQRFRKSPIDTEAAAAEARAVAEIGETNWTGRLIEYRNAHPTKEDKGLFYNETSRQTPGVAKFKCSIKILEHEQEFGDPTVCFTKKKDAKQYASKKAIDWLIDNKFMPGDGSVKWPKPAVSPTAKVIGPQVPKPLATKSSKSMSFAQQVPELCIKLGLNMPKYEIEKVCEEPALYKGYAHFQGDPRIVESKIGVVTDVFGQKNTKEMIAEEVLSFLKDIESQRAALSFLEDIERERAELKNEEDKKRKRSLASPESEGSKEKLAKLDGSSKYW